MAWRKLDYYMKGLSIDIRQELFSCFKLDISETMMRYFLQKEEGYEDFHSMSFTDEQINVIWDQVYIKKLEKINDIMKENQYPPLFSDITDSYRSAKEYFELFQIRSKEELTELFGCSFQDYVPEKIE